MTCRRIALAWIAMLLPTALAAQPFPGDRLRIGLTQGGAVIGTFVDTTPAVLLLRQGGVVVEVERTRIGELERSLGVRDDFVRNFVVSIGVGALLVGGYTALSYDLQGSDCMSSPFDRRDMFALGAVGGGILGIPIGIIAGIASRGERWEAIAVPSPADVTLMVRPTAHGGVGFGLRVPIAGLP